MAGRLAWISIAPVKSLGLLSVECVELEPSGVRGNRRFFVTEPDGRLLNGTRLPRLMQVIPAYDEDAGRLTLRFPDGRVVSAEVTVGEAVTPSMYGRSVPARVVTGPFAAALSEFAGRPLRLLRVEVPGDGVDRGVAGAVSLVSTAALDALAQAAGVDGPLDGRRFRMLFGVDGIPAHSEDGWIDRAVRIGAAVVVPRGHVGRCAVTTKDPDTGETDLDTLRVLKAYRGDAPTTEALPFGVWGEVVTPGAVRVGDPVALR